MPASFAHTDGALLCSRAWIESIDAASAVARVIRRRTSVDSTPPIACSAARRRDSSVRYTYAAALSPTNTEARRTMTIGDMRCSSDVYVGDVHHHDVANDYGN